MHDCTALYRAHDWEALRTRLRLDGYLLLRDVLDAAAVTKARDFLLDQLQRWRPDAFAEAAPHNVRRLDFSPLAASIWAPFHATSRIKARTLESLSPKT
jgi:hypothetical protein